MLSYRIFRETVPDMLGLGRAEPQLTVAQQEPQEVQPVEVQAPAASKHGAAMELAASTKPIEQISDEPPLPIHDVQEQKEATPAESGSEVAKENVRVQPLKSIKPNPTFDQVNK